MPALQTHLRALVTGLVVLLTPGLSGQETELTEEVFQRVRSSYDRSLGADYHLLNGRQYAYIYSTISHPFLSTAQFSPGNVKLNEVEYRDILINYDVYQQQVVIQYFGFSGRGEQLELNPEFIESFRVEGKQFRRMSFPGTGKRFFQIVYTGEISCFLTWDKDLQYSRSEFATAFNYTNLSRRLYILQSGELYPVRSKSAFLGLFDERYRKSIRRYFRTESINLRKASDKSLRKLMEYCSDLIHPA